MRIKNNQNYSKSPKNATKKYPIPQKITKKRFFFLKYSKNIQKIAKKRAFFSQKTSKSDQK